MPRQPSWYKRIIEANTPYVRVVKSQIYPDVDANHKRIIKCFTVLECGHNIDEVATSPITDLEVGCKRCGIERAKVWMSANPEETAQLKSGAIRADGRPKPKLRSQKKQEKFLRQVQARHNAVFEPGKPRFIED